MNSGCERKALNEKGLDILAIIVLILFTLLVLPSSPLRSGNTWDDTNAMLRIGQLWMNGTLPFRDVFEQRGLIMYIYYLVANIFNQSGYFGLYLIEAANLVMVLFLSKSIITNFFHDRRHLEASIGALLTVLLIVTNYSFKNGGSPEEFSLVWILLGVLGVQKYLNDQNSKHIIQVGVGLAVVFNIKYSLIGPWIALGVIVFYSIFRSKSNILQKILTVLCYGAMGVLIIFAPIGIYLALTHSTQAFIYAYFIENLTGYTKESLPIVLHIV